MRDLERMLRRIIREELGLAKIPGAASVAGGNTSAGSKETPCRDSSQSESMGHLSTEGVGESSSLQPTELEAIREKARRDLAALRRKHPRKDTSMPSARRATGARSGQR